MIKVDGFLFSKMCISNRSFHSIASLVNIFFITKVVLSNVFPMFVEMLDDFFILLIE